VESPSISVSLSSNRGRGPTEDEDVEIRVHDGGRAQFDETVFKMLGARLCANAP
jgi:hypothetical protein